MALQHIIIEYKTHSGTWRPAGRSGQMTEHMIAQNLKDALKSYPANSVASPAVRAVTKTGQLLDMLM
mgnify:CR=1 FL=1